MTFLYLHTSYSVQDREVIVAYVKVIKITAYGINYKAFHVNQNQLHPSEGTLGSKMTSPSN
jgi:hypothetical protein